MSGCTGTGKRIQILLSTYNGETYLKEQLDSFLSLENFSVCNVLIRDDGSTDRTRSILREYEKRKDFKIYYGENIGITKSYYWLLQNSDQLCEYFAFSDQDDVWLPNKLKLAIDALDECPPNIPVLFASATQIVDAELRCLNSRGVVKNCRISYYNAMVQNVLPGHTQVMNRKLREVILQQGYDDIHVIDWWYYLVASGIGVVKYCSECTVLHRQHDGNAVGMQKGLFLNIFRRIQYIKEGRGNAFSKQLYAFYMRYKSMLPEEYSLETEAFLGHLPSVRLRLRYIVTGKVYRQGLMETWIFKLLYVLGKYKL
ncbi:MAG: glycosyltransferase [Oscillospiraceae bacterium]|nr:glycosyltransferase [Oscillospiraceae bacterium]